MKQSRLDYKNLFEESNVSISADETSNYDDSDNIIVKLALEKISYHVDIPYSYKIPSELKEEIFLGQRVIVPFGMGNNKREAVVIEISTEKTDIKLKNILAAIDKEPIISDEMFKLAFWIKEQTFCTFYEAFSLMIPFGFNIRHKIYYRLNNVDLAENITSVQCEIFEYIKTYNKILDSDLFEYFNIKKEDGDILELLEKGYIRREYDFLRVVKDETILMVKLNKNYDNSIKLTEKQKNIVEVLTMYNIDMSIKDLIYHGGVTRVVVDNLFKKDVISIYEKEIFRIPYKNEFSEEYEEIKLTQEQNEVFLDLNKLLKSEKPEISLLFGVTGSGKTQVYLKLVEEALKKNKQVIYLVPEISLTSQNIAILQKYFGSEVAVLHSGLSLGERLDEYKRLKSGLAKIAVGTRSAIFSPLDNIGLIIIDEEQEYTYKSEQTPRYHARDVAKFRCNEHNALLVLGSATPSLETYYQSINEKYNFFEIKERYGNATLPKVFLVDMNEEKSVNHVNILSKELENEIKDKLNKKEQSILFLNRRGFNRVATCVECEEKIICPNCSIAMTFHKTNNRLVCHYCGHMISVPKTCSHCNGEIRLLGLGTQKVEEFIEETFNGARVLRMDQDTTMAKLSHDEKLASFRNHEYDIMIGTQMVTKGLDFANVTLVGVLNADQSLYSSDFRAYERTFSLLTQVVGRSGRGDKEGKAYIQTFTPQSDVIYNAAMQDYKAFYDSEITTRKAMIYPPFSSFCVIGFAGEIQNKVGNAAKVFLSELEINARKKKNIPLRVLGPMPGYIEKIAGKYRFKIIIKCVNNKETRSLLDETLKKYYGKREANKINTFIDMNYYGNI